MKRTTTRSKYHEIDVTALSHEGRGIGKKDGKTVFVFGALPGERVVVRLLKKRPNFDEAEVVTIVKPSELRVEAKCVHFGVCGGCSLQHMNEQGQLSHKQNVLLELLRHHAEIFPEVVCKPIPSVQWGYRKKARLGVKWVKGKDGIVIGFREKSKSFITNSSRCEVLDPRVGEKIQDLKLLIEELTIADQIPQLEVAITKHVVSIIIRHLAPMSAEDMVILKRFGKEHDFYFYLQSGGPDTVVPLEGSFKSLSYDLDGIVIQFDPGNFTQINSDVNEAMVKKVLEYLEPEKEDKILDLYCGIGNFSLPMAANGSKVQGYELDQNMVSTAKINAENNNMSKCEFFTFDLNDVCALDSLDISGMNKVLLDPPRSGANAVFEALCFKNVDQLVYVSCNPFTFSKDAGILKRQHAFKLKEVSVLDMFPQTSHFESIGFFAR